MYLTASLSNPLDSLSFNTIRSPPSLSYTPDVQNSIEIPEEDQPSVGQFTLPNGAIFGAPIIQPSNQLHQLPFSNNSPQLPAEFSVSPVELDYNQGDTINIYPGSDQGHPQRPAETLVNGEYVSSIDPLHSGFNFPSTQIPYSNLASHLSSNPSGPSSKSPPNYHYPILSHPSPVRPRRGLSGWNVPQSPERPTERPFVVNIHKKRLRSVSPSPAVAFRRPQGSKPISSTNSAQTSSVRDSQRSRNSNGRVSLVDESVPQSDARELEMDSDDLGDDDAESDDYRPSRSPSVDPAYPPSYPVQFLRETGTEQSGPSKKKAKRGKGKAKGSAALALAVVTQLGATKSREGSEQFDDDFDPLAVYHEGRHGIRKRKNHPIPLPVPIPNLNKKSRGRKVPFVADLTSSGGSASPSGNSKGGHNLDDSEGGMVRSSTRSRRKSSRMPTPVTDELAGSRSYVCVVPGCGKCFVRGEHLKRHVRSIHTHDKPHPCPFEGCDKSFSRRDNLGQHVRIHLQP
ncbi:hypothetical protein BJ912DRAFT_852554 [Pholiota molesta]|nr:hypothetical protein BJ912DRAFT_852554 [Pholiota molesta]